MKRSIFQEVSCFKIMLAFAFLALATVAAPAQTQCVETNGVKFMLPPNTDGGLDVKDSGGSIVLADDFYCDITGPVSDIHLWGSWLSNVHGTITNFWLGIYSDVPAVTNFASGQVTNSHPGVLLWQQSFGLGQYAESPNATGSELFYDPSTGSFTGTDTQAWYYCFYPTNAFKQQGTATAPTNYWLAVYAQVANQTGTYGWKTSVYPYHDPAVWGTVLATSGFPTGNWKSMTNNQTSQPINLAFKLTTQTNPPPPPPLTGCSETNGAKYVQWPNLDNGFDVWDDGPWVLADDFICTNTGPITDIHLWGSWLNDQVQTNSLTFWLAIYDNVPAGPGGGFSQPGNLLWQEQFGPDQYIESFWSFGQESFLDPGPPNVIGPDSQVWYYCFYPTNIFIQQGSTAAPKTYWLMVYSQLPAGNEFQYGWKSTPQVQNDTSVHAPWPNMVPTNNPGWTPTQQLPTGGPLDLAFKINTANNPCIDIVCPSNVVLYMPCGFSCVTISNYPPAFATNLCSPAAGVTVTYSPPPGFCFPLGTTWVEVTAYGSGQSNSCSFPVTVLNNPNCPPTNGYPCLGYDCPSNLVLYMPCGFSCVTVSNYPPAFATNYCSPAAGVTVTYSPPPGFCFPLGTTPVTMTVSGSGQTSNCTFSVTVLNNPDCPSNPPPVVCVESDYEKIVQGPNINGGLDVWNNPYVLADDFVCTNTGPISDIHLWGSWLGDQALTNSITFWLGIYDDVPTNAINHFSHPGTNLLWQQWFAPGQYAETIWTANASEQFLDPGLTNILGTDSEVWYYCFYPTNAFEQMGTPTNSKTYWLAAYAQLPAGTQYQYGWKTTTNVQHDVSVHAFWPGLPPTNNPGWTPTSYRLFTGGLAPLDLAFKLTMCGPVKIRWVTPNDVVLSWPGGGYLQSATNVTGPYIDVPGFPPSPYTDSTLIPPTNRFYRVRCY